MPTQLKAGAASVVITPPVGVDLCGFGAREGASVALHDDLYAGALYLESNLPLLIMTCDLIGIDDASVAEIRQEISALTAIPAGNIMVGCSHTHSGPATPCIRSLGKVDQEYFAVLKRKLIGLGKMAFDQRQPAALGYLREPVAVGINRRTVKAGQMIIGRNDAGVTAPWADVISVDTMEGKPIARYFVHAAHAVTLSGLDITADWPGYARRAVEAIYGEGCVAMFGQGCCGNINSDPRGTYEIAEAQGRVMAGAVVKAAEYCLKEAELTLGCAYEVLQLPCFDPPTIEEAEAQLASIRETAASRENPNRGIAMMDAGDIEWAERILELAKAGATGLTRSFEVQAMRIGDFGLVGLPGEVFVEYALNMDRAPGYKETATMAYTNGNVGYVPTAAAHAEGGYEVTHAIRFYGDTMLRPESEQMIVECGLRLLHSLR